MSQSFYVLTFSRITVRVVAPDKQNKPLCLSLLVADEGIVDYTNFLKNYIISPRKWKIAMSGSDWAILSVYVNSYSMVHCFPGWSLPKSGRGKPDGIEWLTSYGTMELLSIVCKANILLSSRPLNELKMGLFIFPKFTDLSATDIIIKATNHHWIFYCWGTQTLKRHWIPNQQVPTKEHQNTG